MTATIDIWPFEHWSQLLYLLDIKHLENSSGHTLTFSQGISHPVFYNYLVYKLRRVKDAATFVSSVSNIVQRLQSRKYDSLITERTIGLVLGPSTALCRSFPKALPSNLQAGLDYMTGLVQTFSEETKSWSSSPLIVSRNFFSPWIWARASSRAEHSLLWRMSFYIFNILFYPMGIRMFKMIMGPPYPHERCKRLLKWGGLFECCPVSVLGGAR